jgi:hypothetical protein
VETEWRSWVDDRVKKHDKDLYEGNGKPSLTVRMDRVERYCENQSKWTKAIVLLLLSAIFAALGDIFVRAHG